MTQLLVGIEGGGTKFIVAVGTMDGRILSENRIPTTNPQETISRCVESIKNQTGRFGVLAAIGVASFGPLDIRPASATYGHVLPTPKAGWTGANLISLLRDEFDVPTAIDTDVNGAALGEWRWGAAKGFDTFIYLTIGTGIGGGGLFHGQLMHGLLHPEMGHIPLPKTKDAVCVCPFHEDCFEGLASGPAIEKRWGEKAINLPPGHPAWELEAGYIAIALRSFICTFSPQRIVLGGGVMEQGHLFPMIRKKTLEELNGYIQMPEILEKINEYIVPVELDGKAGILGAFVLAENVLRNH
jgi:fructokinase